MKSKVIWKRLSLALLCLTASGAMALGNKGKIPIVGINEKGEEEILDVTPEEYKQKTSLAAVTVYDSIMPVLNKQEAKPSKWGLRVLGVGIGVTAEFGIGPVKVGVIPKMRFIFTNHTKPPLL